jgi:hypothetical protein
MFQDRDEAETNRLREDQDCVAFSVRRPSASRNRPIDHEKEEQTQ